MPASMTKQAYDYLNLDKLDKKVGAMLVEEHQLNKLHRKTFATAYRRFSTFFYQTAAIALHLTRLIKNILLLLATSLLALVALFNDWDVAYDLGIMAVGRSFLVALNLTNAVHALVSVIINSLATILYKTREITKSLVCIAPNKETNNFDKEMATRFSQIDLRSLVKKGFFTDYADDGNTTKTILEMDFNCKL